MNFTKPPGPAEIGRPLAMEAEENIRVLARGNFRQVENGDGEASADSLRALLGRVSETSRAKLIILSVNFRRCAVG
jgi:hypothetical protein